MPGPTHRPGSWGPGGIHQYDRACIPRLRLVYQYLADLGVPLSCDERYPGFGDAGLLPSDAPEIVPEVVRVLQSDLGHDARERRDDVRAVQPAAQSHLDHRDVHAPSRQIRER